MARFRVLGALLVALLAGCSSTTGGSGGCAAPGVDPMVPATASVGEVVTVSGRYFLSECGDTTANGVAATSRAFDGTLTLSIHQGRRSITLAHAEVDDAGAFTTKVTLPEELDAGPAEVRVDFANAYGATLTVVD